MKTCKDHSQHIMFDRSHHKGSKENQKLGKILWNFKEGKVGLFNIRGQTDSLRNSNENHNEPAKDL